MCEREREECLCWIKLWQCVCVRERERGVSLLDKVVAEENICVHVTITCPAWGVQGKDPVFSVLKSLDWNWASRARTLALERQA